MMGLINDGDSLGNKFIDELKKAGTHKKIKVESKDPSHSITYNRKFIQYEHQIFTEKGIPAVTITARDEKLTHKY